MSNDSQKEEKNINSDIILENTNKIIEQAKELSLVGIPEECKSCAKNFFNCIHEELKPYDASGRLYSKKELQNILKKEVIPKCKKLYDLDKCLEQYNINKREEESSEEEEEEEELKL